MKACRDTFRSHGVWVKAGRDAFRSHGVWVKAYRDAFRGRGAWVKGEKRRRLCLPLRQISELYLYIYDILRYHHPRLWIGHAYGAA